MPQASPRRCKECDAEVSGAGLFCSSCGRPLLSEDLPTLSSPIPGSGTPSPRRTPSEDAAPAAGGRFIPGTLVAGRYRIIGLLGKGGMGEVYRADDLKLGQAVALKFLPQSRSARPGSPRAVPREVRLARQVSHPNVCRVYDIDEVEGLHFLIMEYVDGEDLASLLRRIGHLPADKALEVARQALRGSGRRAREGRPPPRPEAREHHARRPRPGP